MKVLFIGGTGVISSACAELAVARGFELTVLNRGQRKTLPGVRQLTSDITNPAATAAAVGGEHWDAVVDYIAFTPAELEPRIALFRGRTAQYIFISSASAYAAGESVLGLFAKQTGVRRTAAARFAGRGISRDDCSSVVDLQ